MSDKPLTTLAEVWSELDLLRDDLTKRIRIARVKDTMYMEGVADGTSEVKTLLLAILSRIPTDPPAEPEKPVVRCPECGAVAEQSGVKNGLWRCRSCFCPVTWFRPEWFEGKP